MRRERYRSGPLVWLAIVAATCVLLFMFQKILWLVVPFLLAFPWISAHLVAWQDSGARYIEGGQRFVAETLAWAEQNYTFTGTYLAAAWFPSLLLAPFLAFFFLRDGWRFKMFLSRAVPNAFFERTLYLLDQVDHTARLYFQGLIKLTVLDALCLACGLALIGVSAPFVLGVMTAVLAWIPYVGSILGCLLVVLVAATDFPGDPAMAYAAIGLFVGVRLLDDFFFMPITIGRSLKLHPLLTVVMIFVGGAVAGVAGLMLVLPLLGIVMVLGEMVGAIVTDARLRARHVHARALRQLAVTRDLQI